MANNKALLVIDMLNDFIDPNGVLFCGETAAAIVPVVSALLESHRKAGNTIIYLCDSHEKDDREFARFPAHCVKGTWGAGIIPELSAASSDIVIPKTRYSGFFRTDLDSILKKHEISQAVVCGVCTSICVMDTVGGLANRDIDVIVPQNAVADFDPEFHEFALRRMEKIYGAKIA